MKNLAGICLVIVVMLCSGCLGSSDSDCGSSCHDVPPATGAHLAHTDGLLPMSCDTCHGEGASDSDHQGHDNGSLTILGLKDYEDNHGPRPAWYGSVWGSAALFDGHDPGSSVCSGLACHGMDPVGWTQDLGAAWHNRVCMGCHDITPAEFQIPGSGTVYSASTAAANYEGPLSGFSRGGHGDEGINNPAWFSDTAPGSSVPLACVTCHDADSPHFPTADDNPYRMPALALAFLAATPAVAVKTRTAAAPFAKSTPHAARMNGAIIARRLQEHCARFQATSTATADAIFQTSRRSSGSSMDLDRQP